MLQYYAFRIAIWPGFSAIHSSGEKTRIEWWFDNRSFNQLSKWLIDWFLCGLILILLQPSCSNSMFVVHTSTKKVEIWTGYVIIRQSYGRRNTEASWTTSQVRRRCETSCLDAWLFSHLLSLAAQEICIRIIKMPWRWSERTASQMYSSLSQCNPKWSEITSNIKPWEKAEHRPDLLSRVFKLKLDELLSDIRKKHVLGVPTAYLHVIEFQKSGLPHAHILVILRAEDKIRTTDDIDEVVSAEIPDQTSMPRLHDAVIRHMIHGPCGVLNPNSACMTDGDCSKEFLKAFAAETALAVKGYPSYRRRDNGVRVERSGKEVDYRWVVPDNPFLLLRYDAHINVEICTTIKSVKYLYKYVYKGKWKFGASNLLIFVLSIFICLR